MQGQAARLGCGVRVQHWLEMTLLLEFSFTWPLAGWENCVISRPPPLTPTLWTRRLYGGV